MLKHGCTLPMKVNVCLYKPTDSKIYPFTEADEDLPEKLQDDMGVGPSTVFTRKTVADDFFRNSMKL